MTSVKISDRIKLIAMPNDPDPIPPGAEGVVVDVTTGSLAQISVNWDNGRTLSLIDYATIILQKGNGHVISE